MTRLRCIACIAFALCALSALPAGAAPLDWGLRLSRQTSWTQQDFSSESNGVISHLELFDAAGWELAGDVRLAHRFSVRGAWSQLQWNEQAYRTVPLEFPSEPTAVVHGQVTSNTYSLGGIYHPLTTQHFDGYVGPIAGLTTYSFIDTRPTRDFSYGLEVGFQYAIGDTPLRLGLELRHLQVAHSQVSDRDSYSSFAADSAALTLGYRFRH